MSVHSRHTVGALLASAAVLVVAGWYDADVVRVVERDQTAQFAATQTAVAVPFLGFLLVVAGVLILGALARWADSRFVDVAFLAGGAFLTSLSVAIWTGAASATFAGPLDAISWLGAALLLLGAADMVRARRRGSAWPAVLSPASRAAERCIACGDDTSAGSPLFSDRLVAHDGDGDRYLCADCARRIRDGRGSRELSDSARRRLDDAAFAFGAFTPGGH